MPNVEAISRWVRGTVPPRPYRRRMTSDDRDSALRLRRLVKECLTQRESEVIRLRYGLGGTVPLTQREIASTFGISRSYVSRIEKRALEKLRAELEKPVGSGAGQ